MFVVSFLFAKSQGLPPPPNVTVSVTTSTSVTVQWLPVSSAINSQPAYKYRVRWAFMNVRTSVTVAATSYTIRGLKPFTTYEVRVAVVDLNQIGTFSGAVRVQTLEGGKQIGFVRVIYYNGSE